MCRRWTYGEFFLFSQQLFPVPLFDVLLLLDSAPGVYPDDESEEDDHDPDDARGGDRVGVDDAGEEDGEGLSQGHDDCEGHGTEAGNCEVDEELTNRSAHAEHENVNSEIVVFEHELGCFEETALFNEGHESEQTGEQVDSEHHLCGRHLVHFEQLSLPVRSERVEGHVTQHQHEAAENDDALPVNIISAGWRC